MRQCSVTKLERRNEQTFAMLWGLLILGACAGDEHQKMLAHLEELERQNLADSVMANDSLAERLAVYFDQHGTTNERMRAHYILGRTYADLGEAPAALDEYHIAADCTDTTATDCDYRILTRVYVQTTSLFYKQLMPNEMLEEFAELKQRNDAVILAHYYVDPDAQDLADFVGDSYFLARKAASIDCRTLVFAGVEFMAESAKLLSPQKRVLMPEPTADCPMAHMLRKETVDEMADSLGQLIDELA